MRSKSDSNFKSGNLTFRKKVIIIGFALYITFILLSRVPYFAESYVRGNIDENMDAWYTYDLVFPIDGESSHYYAERENTDEPGEISITYFTSSHTVQIEVTNLKVLTIDCQKVYTDEGFDVFGIEPSTDPELYKTYFSEERDKFTVNVNSDTEIAELRFKNAPEPVEVYVNNVEWWKANLHYSFESGNVVLTNVPLGTTKVEMFFKERIKPEAFFIIQETNTEIDNGTVYGLINKEITFDASASNDDADNGIIERYEWSFGDDKYGAGKIITHT